MKYKTSFTLIRTTTFKITMDIDNGLHAMPVAKKKDYLLKQLNEEFGPADLYDFPNTEEDYIDVYSIIVKEKSDSLDDLVAFWKKFCEENDLPHICADELACETLTKEQAIAVNAFKELWEVVESS